MDESLVEGAYNTILIAAEKDSVTPAPDANGCAVATVRNPRANDSIAVQMAEASVSDGITYYQAFVRVLDPLEENHDGTLAHESSDPGPACADYTTGVIHANTAAILARHGDRITIKVEGAGEVTVDVDGEGPDVTGITPEDLSYVRSSSLHYSFAVRDNDAGLRHDGESIISSDGGLHGGEPGQRPRHDRRAALGRLLQRTDYYERGGRGDRPEGVAQGHRPQRRGRHHGGSWTLLGNAPGVAYSFSADGGNTDEGVYLMEVSAYDRTGNRTVTEAPDDEYPGPYAFIVDDTDPSVVQAWTGIAYDPDLTMMGKVVQGEVADRSWIMVEFTEPVRTGIDPDRIRVAGHEVVSVFQPNYAPSFVRIIDNSGTNTLPSGAPRPTFAPPRAPRRGFARAPGAGVHGHLHRRDTRSQLRLQQHHGQRHDLLEPAQQRRLRRLPARHPLGTDGAVHRGPGAAHIRDDRVLQHTQDVRTGGGTSRPTSGTRTRRT